MANPIQAKIHGIVFTAPDDSFLDRAIEFSVSAGTTIDVIRQDGFDWVLAFGNQGSFFTSSDYEGIFAEQTWLTLANAWETLRSSDTQSSLIRAMVSPDADPNQRVSEVASLSQFEGWRLVFQEVVEEEGGGGAAASEVIEINAVREAIYKRLSDNIRRVTQDDIDADADIEGTVDGIFEISADGAHARLAFEGEVYQVPENTPHIRAMVRHSISRREFIGGRNSKRKYRHRAYLILHVATPINTGVFEADRIAHRIRKLFEGISLDPNNIQFEACTISEQGQDDSFNRFDVSIPFEYQTG